MLGLKVETNQGSKSKLSSHLINTNQHKVIIHGGHENLQLSPAPVAFIGLNQCRKVHPIDNNSINFSIWTGML